MTEHEHVFLGAGHERNERRTWWVIGVCSAMMIAEIAGGVWTGSIALVADGLHMSTHAGALLLAALAYTLARRHARDPRFTFGTGKLGDLAGFTSAIALFMIALLIGYEAVDRFIHPVPIHFREAIPIACLGLAVNVASALLLGLDHHGGDDSHVVKLAGGELALSVFEDGVPPRFRLKASGVALPADARVVTTRPNGDRQTFAFVVKDDFLESLDEIPEPHEFLAHISIGDGREHAVAFAEDDEGAHGHGHHHHHDNNMRAALVHVMADAAVSVLVIIGLLLARAFGWSFTDPVAGIIGAVVITSWSWTLVRDTGAILLDMHPDRVLDDKIRRLVEGGGDRVVDLHVWRLGPGHLGAVIAVATKEPRAREFYRAQLERFRSLSHVTVEVQTVGYSGDRLR